MSGRIATLDLLRFIAALAVVLYHYIARPEAVAFQSLEPIARFGYLGVPIFFMISGYVIALSADNRSAYQFFVSRFVRLYPALWFSVLVTVLVVTLLSGRSFGLMQVLANFTLLNDYLGYANIDGVYWTLQAELKFYLCVFVLVLTGLFERYHLWLTLWLVATGAYLLFQQPFFMGWFITPFYSSFFIVGVCFYLIQKYGFDLYNSIVLVISSALCANYAYRQAADFIGGSSASDAITASIIVLVAILIFICIAKNLIVLNAGKFFFTLGALTYPLYLLHNSAGKAIIDADLFSGIPQSYLIVTVIALMLGLSYMTFRFIETPIARGLKRLLL